MRIKKWLTLSVCALVFAVSLSAAFGMRVFARASTKNGKVISDITEYSSVFFDLSGETPALKSVETQTGAWVDNTYALNIGDAIRNFTDSHGISFKAKSSSQWAIGQGIWVKLGGSDICFNKSENGLDISIDENVGSWKHITNLPVATFDETVEHVYAISRVKNENNGFTLTIFIDGSEIGIANSTVSFYDDSNKGIFVKNNQSGSAITVSSSYDSYTELSEVYGIENAIDVAELKRDALMALGGERTYAAVNRDEWPIDVANGSAYLSGGTLDLTASHGLTFKMKANGWGNKDYVFRIDLGGTNILFVTNNGNKSVCIDENVGGWRRNATYSIDFDEKQEVLYRVTKTVKEDGGYLVRVYLKEEGKTEKLVAAAADRGATVNADLNKILVISAKEAGGFTLKSTIEDFGSAYLKEKVTDIYDLTGNNAMKTDKGADYPEWNFLRAEYGKDIYGNVVLGDSDGIVFKAKWAEQSDGDQCLRVYLGGTEVRVERWGATHLYIVEKLNSSGEVQDIALSDEGYADLDLTKEHVYKITRTKSLTGNTHLIRFYIDDKLMAAGVSDSAMQKTGDWDWGCVRVENARYWNGATPGRQDANVTIKSCDAAPVPSFEEEKGVNDLFYMSNDASLLTPNGKSVAKGNVTNLDWIRSTVNDTDGIEFAIQTQATNAWDVVRVLLGSMDIRLNLHGGDIWFFVYGWDNIYGNGELGVHGSEFYSGKQIDNAKHTLKITRRKAISNGGGYNVDIYWDGESVVSAFMPIGLTNDESNGITVKAGAAVTFYSLLNANEILPEFEQEKCNDILYYGGDLTNLLRDGKDVDTLLYSADWMHEDIVAERLGTNGIEFKMQANSKIEGWEKIMILMGFTDIRFNFHDDAFFAHVYNWGSVAPHEGLWGFEHYLGQYDETQEHTVKITRRMAKNGKGLSVRIYIDGDLVCDTYEPYATAYSTTEFGRRVVAIRGSGFTFKSGFDISNWNLEEEVINDLFSVKDQNRDTYNESALNGVTVPLGNRIINNVWDEEFASVSNGLEFKIKPATAGESWKTSGNALVFLPAQEGDEGAVKGADGKWYKPTREAWTSEWVDSWVKNTWMFPAFYRDSQGRMCNWTTLEPFEDAYADLAFRYHLNVDWGTTRIEFKLLPDGKLMVREFNRYSGAVLFESVVVDNFDSSAEHIIKMARVREKTTGGFITKLWIDNTLVMETYDPSPLGRSGDVFSHFLLDNMTGIDIVVTNVRTLDEIKTGAKELYSRNENDYSAEYWAKVQEIVNAANEQMDSLESLKAIQNLAELTSKKVDEIWTKAVEARFVQAKTEARGRLDSFISGKNYNAAELEKINGLLAAGKAEISSSVDFRQLETITQIWLDKIGAVKTTEQLTTIAAMRTEAENLLNNYFAQFEAENYSAENYAEIDRIKTNYAALIAESEDEATISTLPLMAKAEMSAVRTAEQTTLESLQNAAQADVESYIDISLFAGDNKLLAENIILQAKEKIASAKNENEMNAIVATAKLQLDGLEKAPAPVPAPSAFASWGWIVLVSVLAAAVAVAVPVTFVFIRKKKGEKNEK